MLDQVLFLLANGDPARYQRYDWDTNQLAEWHAIDPSHFMIIEGVGASRLAFRRHLAATVWVKTGSEERLRRGLQRDGEDALSLWERWMRDEDDYVAREHPEQSADLVVSGEFI